MKILIILSTLFFQIFAAQLNWEHNYDKALLQAKVENKNVYLFIGADVCRWCDRFKDMTLSNQALISKLKEDYILLYMSRDRHQIPKHFAVKGVPRHYFLTPQGEIIYTTRGSREIDGFYSLLEEVELATE
ncbi:DUF255 domain-containing protein [Sulfurimonas sp.]|nr:DUF255 domain-containing protein [Sulfurimonas sp.]